MAQSFEDSRADGTFVTRLASEMERVFRLLTGQPLRIFLDVAEIETAQMWEERVVHAGVEPVRGAGGAAS